MFSRRPLRIVAAILLAGASTGSFPAGAAAAAGDQLAQTVVGEDIVDDTPAAAPADAELDLELRYTTVFAIGGNDDADLSGLIEESSQLKALEDKPTATYTGLVRRAEADMERLDTVLRSEGYYDGAVSFTIDEATSPATVTVSVEPAQRYRLAGYDIVWTGGAAPEGVTLAKGVDVGMPAEAQPIAAVQTRLIDQLQAQGRPFARVVDRVARIDRADKSMQVTLSLDAGAMATFGPTTISGLERLDPAFVRSKIPWQQGERYDETKIEALRTTLLGLGLFKSAKVEPAKATRDDGQLPVSIDLIEGKPRSIGAGAAYSTSEGFLLDVFWEHRNLFGNAEKLRITGTLGTLTQKLGADFRKPDYLRLDQALLANSALIRTTSDAYDESTWANYLGLERKLSDRWRASAGGSFELSKLSDQDSTDTVQLFGLPLSATRDNRDDVLNPTKGSLLGFEVVPYGGHSDKALAFGLGRVSASSYLALDDRRRFILAGRTRIASLVGEETRAIPANKRLYAGGGGSIRGYEFQKVGPLGVENDPVGGRSLFEVGLEMRMRVTDEIGIVPFVEGGNVWDSNVPKPTDSLRWAAGLGLRYYTPIGPARIDFAVPINKRKDIDDAFQVYFSLGQAF